MRRSTAGRRRFWTALTAAAILLWPLAVTADLLCEHCASSALAGPLMAAHAASEPGAMAMEHHPPEGADHPSTSEGLPCCDAGGCASDGQPAPAVPEVDGLVPQRNLAFPGSLLLGAAGLPPAPGAIPSPIRPGLSPVPDLPRLDGALVYLAVSSFLL